MPPPIPAITAVASVLRPRRAWLLVALLVVAWAFEITLVQHWTTLPEAALSTASIVKVAARRAILSLAACAAVVCLLRGWLLTAAFGLWAVAATVLIVFATYFEAPLSWPVIAAQWREGLAVSDSGLAIVSRATIVFAISACVLKVALASLIPHDELNRRGRRIAIASALGVYVAMAIALTVFVKPLRQIRIGTPEYMYGYAVAWGAEMLWFDREALLAEATEKARAKSDTLTAVEEPFELGRHVAVVQVESLDFAAVEAHVDGQPVMPFLRSLRDASMLYSVRPFHAAGSCDADFSLLMAATPIGRFNPFQVMGFSYGDALPRLARERGYRSVAIHGNTGEFFQRRRAYEQMGFDELLFMEELTPQGVAGAWDDQLLAHSAKLLAAADEPTLHFVITITSHTPFDKLPPDNRELFREPRTVAHRYLNSMRYVDRALERYMAALPAGTTVVLYGDHESNVQGYADSSRHEDRVPWLIVEKERDLSLRQRSRESGLALSGTLTQLDMACFLRERMAASRPADDGGFRPGIGIAREDDGPTVR